MYKKKLSTIAIITILTLSILLAAMPMASAAPPIDIAPLTPVTLGPVGTEVTVAGATASASPFGLVEVYWDTLATKIKEGYATSTGAYSITKVKIPAGIQGAHDVIVKDVLSSTIASTTFTITPEIKLSTTKGLPGDSVTVTGTGFGDEVAVGIGLGAEVTETAEAVGIGDNTTKAFTLDYSPIKPTTEVISAPGTGFTTLATGAGTPTIITVTAPTITADFIAGLYDAAGTLELLAPTASTGADDALDTVVLTYTYVTGTTYTVKITAADEAGVYTVIDNGVPVTATPITISVNTYTRVTDYAINNVTGVITFVTAPESGVPITATYTRYTYKVTPVAGITTNATGSFSAVIIIPAIPVGSYGAFDVTAVDAAGNTDAYVTLTVNYYVNVSPTSGPTGITITISGRIPASTPYELRIDTTTIATGTSEANTSFSQTYVIPSLISLGNHDVTVVWATTNTRTAIFAVTAPPQVSFTPTSGVPGKVVTISTVAGKPFSAKANITLYLGTTIVNSTATDDRFGPTGSTGTFTNLEFTVPTLAPGVYVLKVVDEYGASTGTTYTFTVLAAPVTTIALRGTTYYPCCTLSFNIVTTDTFTAGPDVTIRDPSGAIWWMTTIAWPLKGTGIQSVYYQDQLVNAHPIKLPLDAPLGSWNWTVTYTPASTGLSTKATGLFTVAEQPTMQTVLDRLDVLNANITSIITTAKGDIIAVINTKSGTITTSLSALDPKLQGIEDTTVIIATMLGEVQVDIAALDFGTMGADITSIKNGMATIQTSIGTVTAGVAALDAKVSSISGDVATVKTTVVTLEGKITAIEGNVATIETDVGTLQADISDVKAKPDVDMTPVWIAVVLSLVAAIAAIFAVITIRQKIAG